MDLAHGQAYCDAAVEDMSDAENEQEAVELFEPFSRDEGLAPLQY